MSENARVAMIRERLTTALAPESLDIVDESHKHAGHEGAKRGGRHFVVTIVADAFNSKKPLERHRMVYNALGEAMNKDIHALSIKAYATDEI
jgi:BolA protein